MTALWAPRRQAALGLLATAGAVMTPGLVAARDLSPIELPPPRADFGSSLAQALRARQSQREFAPRALPPLVLSVGAAVGRLWRESAGNSGPHRAVLAACTGDRHPRRHGERDMALRCDRASACAASRG